jgi:hypothetical protein
MDTEVLQAMSPCTNEKGKCHWWDALRGNCYKPDDTKCPQGVRQPLQEVMDMDYMII